MSRGRGDNEGMALRLDPVLDITGFRAWWISAPSQERLAYHWPANLDYLDLSDLDLSGCDLSQRSLYGAKLSWSDLAGTDFSNSDLRSADLTGAHLDEKTLVDQEKCDVKLPQRVEREYDDQDNLLHVTSYYPDANEDEPAVITYGLPEKKLIQEEYWSQGKPLMGPRPHTVTYDANGNEESSFYLFETPEGPIKCMGTHDPDIATLSEVGEPEGSLLVQARERHPSLASLIHHSYPDGLSIELIHEDGTYEAEYLPSKNSKKISKLSVWPDGHSFYKYDGWRDCHRTDGPVAEDFTPDGTRRYVYWGYEGTRYEDENLWRAAVIGPRPQL
jgi:hypothetical protein